MTHVVRPEKSFFSTVFTYGACVRVAVLVAASIHVPVSSARAQIDAGPRLAPHVGPADDEAIFVVPSTSPRAAPPVAVYAMSVDRSTLPIVSEVPEMAEPVDDRADDEPVPLARWETAAATGLVVWVTSEPAITIAAVGDAIARGLSVVEDENLPFEHVRVRLLSEDRVAIEVGYTADVCEDIDECSTGPFAPVRAALVALDAIEGARVVERWEDPPQPATPLPRPMWLLEAVPRAAIEALAQSAETAIASRAPDYWANANAAAERLDAIGEDRRAERIRSHALRALREGMRAGQVERATTALDSGDLDTADATLTSLAADPGAAATVRRLRARLRTARAAQERAAREAAVAEAERARAGAGDRIRAYLFGLFRERGNFCCDERSMWGAGSDAEVPSPQAGGVVSVAVEGHAVTVTMRGLQAILGLHADERADRMDQYAANVVYHVFEHYPEVAQVSVRAQGTTVNEYGESRDVTLLRLDATRAVFTRLRATGDFRHGPLNIVFGRAALDRVLALFHVRR